MSKLYCHAHDIPESQDGHVHQHAHILLPLTNDLTIRMDGVEYTITKHDLAFIAPMRFHHCISNKKIIMIDIPETLIQPEDLKMLEAYRCVALTDFTAPVVELIKHEAKTASGEDSLRYLFYYLYSKLLEQSKCRSMQYIQEHFSEDISVAQLAKIENYNIGYFTDWFRQRTGMSPSHYIRKVRIEKSKELLISTSFRILDIALQVGYGSNAAFTKAFRDVETISPIQYRKERSQYSTG